MPIYLWVLELFLLILLIHSINAVINPEMIVRWTVERYRRILKFYCFECEIKPSPRSVGVIRIGHLIVAVVLVLYMVLIVVFRQYY